MDEGTDFFRYTFEQQTAGTGFVDGYSVINDGFGGGSVFALNLEASHGGRALRGQTDVAEDYDSCFGNGFNLIGHCDTALKLDGVDIALLHKTDGIADCVFTAGVIGAEGHIPDEVGVRRAAADTLAVSDGHVHCHRDSAFVAVNDHTHGITHQNHVHPGILGVRGKAGVIDHHPDRLLALVLHLLEIENCLFLCHERFLLNYVMM